MAKPLWHFAQLNFLNGWLSWRFMCATNWYRWMKPLAQITHLNGLSTRWCFVWATNDPFWENVLPHVSHANGFSPVCCERLFLYLVVNINNVFGSSFLPVAYDWWETPSRKTLWCKVHTCECHRRSPNVFSCATQVYTLSETFSHKSNIFQIFVQNQHWSSHVWSLCAAWGHLSGESSYRSGRMKTVSHRCVLKKINSHLI